MTVQVSMTGQTVNSHELNGEEMAYFLRSPASASLDPAIRARLMDQMGLSGVKNSMQLNGSVPGR